MVRKIDQPAQIPGPGGKTIEEHVGLVNNGVANLSVAHMIAPPGWTEPAQAPGFDEVVIVIRGALRVEHAGGTLDIGPGETVHCTAGERVRYSNPSAEREAEYWALCVPAFSPDTVNRDPE